MIAPPPLEVGVPQASVTFASPNVPTRFTGAEAVVMGTSGPAILLEGLAPAAFSDLTRNSYVSPLVSPVTVIAGAAVGVWANVNHVADVVSRYSMIESTITAPPLSLGPIQVRATLESPRTPARPDGAVATVIGVAGLDGVDQAPSPYDVTAATR